jgi:hypothetical protein
MSALKFRNITASIDDPVETCPFEGILAAVERGTLPDWQRLAAAIRADPWGPVAQQVIEAVGLSRPYGTTELLTTVIELAHLHVRQGHAIGLPHAPDATRRRAGASQGRATDAADDLGDVRQSTWERAKEDP